MFKVIVSISLLLATTTPGHAQIADANHPFTAGMTKCKPSADKLEQTEYNRCLLREIKKVQPMLAAGVPELNIPPLDPLFLSSLALKRNEPPVSIDAVFNNIRITGIKNMDIKYVNLNLLGAKKSISVGLVVPSLLMRGQYKIGGNVFLLPIEGNGNFIAKMDSVIVEGKSDIIPSGVGLRSKPDGVDVGFKVKSMAMKMDNLFEGNKIMSDTIHHFLNENAQLILNEISPGLTGTLNKMIGGLFTAIFDAAPTELHQHAEALDTAIKRNRRPARRT